MINDSIKFEINKSTASVTEDLTLIDRAIAIHLNKIVVNDYKGIVMAGKYSREIFAKMSWEEIGQILGYDYQDVLAAGGTKEDIYQVINGYKTLKEVIGDAADTIMTEKYSRERLAKMTMGEISQILGYDYRDLLAAGGTEEDLYQIINGYKTLKEVIGDVADTPLFEPIFARPRVPHPWRDLIIKTAALIIALGLAFICIYSINLNPSTPITIAIFVIVPLAYILFNLARRKN